MGDCIFCKIIEGKISSKKVYEDENVLAFLDVSPVNIGHMLVIPKKHFETIDLMDDKSLCEINKVILRLSKGILKIYEGMNVMQNNGSVAGQEVPHVHFHLIPRHSGDGYKLIGFGMRKLLKKRIKSFWKS